MSKVTDVVVIKIFKFDIPTVIKINPFDCKILTLCTYYCSTTVERLKINVVINGNLFARSPVCDHIELSKVRKIFSKQLKVSLQYSRSIAKKLATRSDLRPGKADLAELKSREVYQLTYTVKPS